VTAATVQPRAATGRWAVLGAYALLAACTQLLWLTFAPVTIETARALRVDVGVAGDLAAVFPLVYVGLALPAGRWLDGRFARALGAGAVLTGAGALLRVAVPTSFAWQLAAQLVIAAGQPLVLNAITKVAAGHFPPRERPTAIAIGTWPRSWPAARSSPRAASGCCSRSRRRPPSSRRRRCWSPCASHPPTSRTRRPRPACAGSFATGSCGRSRGWCSSGWASTTRSPRGWSRSCTASRRTPRPAPWLP